MLYKPCKHADAATVVWCWSGKKLALCTCVHGVDRTKPIGLLEHLNSLTMPSDSQELVQPTSGVFETSLLDSSQERIMGAIRRRRLLTFVLETKFPQLTHHSPNSVLLGVVNAFLRCPPWCWMVCPPSRGSCLCLSPTVPLLASLCWMVCPPSQRSCLPLSPIVPLLASPCWIKDTSDHDQ